MSEYVDRSLVAGPLCGHTVTFPATFKADTLEFWMRGEKGFNDHFVQYRLSGDRYQYSGWSWASSGADWSDEAYTNPFANVKGYGRLTHWVPASQLDF